MVSFQSIFFRVQKNKLMEKVQTIHYQKADDLSYDERERLVNHFECVLHYGLLASLRSLSRFPPFLFTWLEGNSENF